MCPNREELPSCFLFFSGEYRSLKAKESDQFALQWPVIFQGAIIGVPVSEIQNVLLLVPPFHIRRQS